jgi:undecaprenyl diphosphate synthase
MTKTKYENLNLPLHVAIISDGNRRWAKSRMLPSLMGHKQGVDTYEKLILKAKDMGIKVLTGWAFSTENWKRSKDEVDGLFGLVKQFAQKFKKICLEEEIRFVHIGRKDRLPTDLMAEINEMEEKTKNFTGFTFVAAADYGGHDELVRATRKIVEQGLQINEETIEANLDTAGLPPVDLIIRTGGEQRLSGYLPWQSAYAELYFTNKFLPEFTVEEFEKAIIDFSSRERRFGGTVAKT